MREKDADAMAEYIRRQDQRGLEARRDGESRPDALFRRQRSASSSSSGAPESSIASGVSGGNIGSANGSQSQVQVSGTRRPSASNKALPPPPPLHSMHPFAAAAQFSTPTQFPTPLQSQFSPTLPLGSYTQPIRNHPIAGEPMPPPATPGRKLRAVASANALGAMAMTQTPRPKRAGTNEGLATSPGQGPMGGRSASAVQSRSGSVARPPPIMPPPTMPLPSAPPPTPPPKPSAASSPSVSRETPKREPSGGGRETPKSGRETPKKDGKETPGRTTLGLRAGVVGVVKPMLSPSALNGSFFSRGDKSSSNGTRPAVEASR
jgi:hypothetical protein